MRTPEDWFENVWLPLAKNDDSTLEFITRIQRDAYLEGKLDGLKVANDQKERRNDPH